MADVEISYNNDEIASLNSSGSIVLETDGTLMADDVTISYTKSAAPVESVNGKTGVVVLTASDVGAVSVDEKVKQEVVTTVGGWVPILMGHSTQPIEGASFSTTTNTTYATNSISAQPGNGLIKATTFKGNLTGNVTGDVTGTASGNYSASNPPPYPVTSVNGSTGAVTVPTVKVGTVSLSSTWSGSGPYTQTVTVSGATVTSNSKVDIQPDATAIAQMISDGCAAIYIDNNAGTLTAYAIGAATTAALTLQVTVTEVS